MDEVEAVIATPDPSAIAPMPSSVSWFAPWTWGRRRKWLGVGSVLLLAAYLALMLPAFLVTHSFGYYGLFYDCYRPIVFLRNSLNDSETLWMDSFLLKYFGVSLIEEDLIMWRDARMREERSPFRRKLFHNEPDFDDPNVDPNGIL